MLRQGYGAPEISPGQQRHLETPHCKHQLFQSCSPKRRNGKSRVTCETRTSRRMIFVSPGPEKREARGARGKPHWACTTTLRTEHTGRDIRRDQGPCRRIEQPHGEKARKLTCSSIDNFSSAARTAASSPSAMSALRNPFVAPLIGTGGAGLTGSKAALCGSRPNRTVSWLRLTLLMATTVSFMAAGKNPRKDVSGYAEGQAGITPRDLAGERCASAWRCGREEVEKVD